MSGKFAVLRCTKCGNFGIKEFRVNPKNVSFNCKFCGKSTKIHNKTSGDMVLFGMHSNPNFATTQCQELKRKTQN